MTKLRGHKIELKKSKYVYSDNKESTIDNWKNRPCGHCGLNFTIEGHDGCVGALTDTMNACCGHGDNSLAYIQHLDGSILRGIDAIKEITKLKSNLCNL